ncbi:translation initiation factor IF-3 [Patescibacteria group bacterium]|nr:translation initiation factor IF-3 [Patescibacteria group bacterium]
MQRPKINNEIKAEEVRLIDEEGKNLGVVKTSEAINMAKEKELELIEISPKVVPPIAKIMDFGKFLYKEKRKQRESAKSSAGEMEIKIIRIHLGTSAHDLALKARKGSEFLKEGHRLKLELFLKGREKYLDQQFLKERLERIINLITEKYKVIQEVRRGPRGIFIIIEKSK